jgi:AcrR family transcriptional regulator
MNSKHHDPLADRRVRRTRRVLRDALVALILERGWDSVTVQDVCARADVGRSTFYVHFADKEELLLSGFDELHAALDTLCSKSRGKFAFVEPLLEHARDNTRLFRALVGKQGGRHILRRFRDVVVRLVEAELDGFDVARERRSAAALFISGGFVELMVTWLERPTANDPKTLSRSFSALADGVLATLEP